MTFKEQLKNDIDRLGTTEEFRNSLSEMLYEQAEKPKPKLYISAVRYGAVAAAVCLLAFGAVKLGLFGENAIDTTSTASGNEAAVRAADTAETAAEQAYENYQEEAESGNDDDFSGGVMYAAPAADEIYPEAAEADGESKEEVYVGAAENSEDYADDEVSIDSVCAAEAPAADEADKKSVDTAGGIFSMSISGESTELSAYDMPVYGKEAIYAKTTIYCADRPWYTFDELVDVIHKNNYRLARVTVGGQLTDDEAAEQPFVNSANEGTYYRAEIDGEEAVVFFFGSAQIQELGNPIYAEGDEIYCALEEYNGIYLIRDYPLGDIYTINGEECVYLRFQSYDINAQQLLSSRTEVVTTTADNAAVYYSAYRLEDFQRELANAVENNN